MTVFKFGGSSVGSPERILRIAELVKEDASSGRCRAVICSAFQGVTDQLILMAREAAAPDERYLERLRELEKRHLDAIRALIPPSGQSPVMGGVKMMLNDLEDVLQGIFLIRELSDRTLDFIMSFGERLSNFIISQTFQHHGIPNNFLDTRQVIRTDSKFGAANVDFKTTNENLRRHFSTHTGLQVVTGFIASTAKNETTTLGRGGSDYTAAILGAALEVGEIVIWTDVDGMLTADPRKVARAFSQTEVSYEEAMEMSHFGAKVIYPPTLQPAMEKKIPIRIKNTLNPDFAGTVLSAIHSGSPYAIKGISSISNISLLRVQGAGMVGMVGVAHRIFGALARGGINIILITQASSEHSVCLAVRPEQAILAKELLEAELMMELHSGKVAEIIVENDLSVLAVVGENMRQTPGIAGKVFQALGSNGINISAIAQGSSELNISAVLKSSDEQKALNAIHNAFFFSMKKPLHLYIAGTGLIGRELLRQIHERSDAILKHKGITLLVHGIANSRTMLFDRNGISTGNWEYLLDERGGPMQRDIFIKTISDINLPNSVFIDCTASELTGEVYDQLIRSGVSVVTANKKANSGEFARFSRLNKLAEDHQVTYAYGTNVGAGLPAIETVRSLVESGDEIISVEGVLSGTLSYLFNSFTGETGFSELVKSAREQGYTEPDPRDDLNGMDAARKILILAREAGEQAEPDAVITGNLLPKEYYAISSVDEFLKKLPELDVHFEKLRKNALKSGKVLRYLARYEKGGGISTGLEEVDAGHPAASLKGSDNILVIRSKEYNERPLVIMGPGAGAGVTANGLLKDVLRC
ncbi:MAG: bifunctional aspartate kinase/homoserine dehydrogenase I [Balneolaceae bacterium]|nr:MAG: bifunctional aspartate kinase/homoserine dehydrogenase I [Balneolaceae bacterium]